MTVGAALRRSLGLSDAVVIGAGSIIGAGGFAAVSRRSGGRQRPVDRPRSVNIGGLDRTVAVTLLLLIVSLTGLAGVVAAGWSSRGRAWTA